MYNERIINVADGISANDAVNLNQLCSAISSIDIPNKLSEFENDTNFGKIFIDDNSSLSLNIKNISRKDYYELVEASAILSNTLYIVSSDALNMYGEQIKNLADGISANDAATYGQLSVIENKVETLIHDIQIIRPVYNGKLHLQLTAYINQEMTDVVITSDSLIDQKYFAAFLNTSDEQKWI
jgi:hypothetical protein